MKLCRENSHIHRGRIKLTHNMLNMDPSQYVPYLYMVFFFNCHFKMNSTINRYILTIKIISLVRYFLIKMVISRVLSFFCTILLLVTHFSITKLLNTGSFKRKSYDGFE